MLSQANDKDKDKEFIKVECKELESARYIVSCLKGWAQLVSPPTLHQKRSKIYAWQRDGSHCGMFIALAAHIFVRCPDKLPGGISIYMGTSGDIVCENGKKIDTGKMRAFRAVAIGDLAQICAPEGA
jgi:hypothetical protein